MLWAEKNSRGSGAWRAPSQEVRSFSISFVRPRVASSSTEAAARGIPPVTAVSQPLVELLGTAVLKPAVARQFAGLVTRAVLADAGFVPIRSGVRVRNDPIFTAGAIYAKRFGSEPKSGGELLNRLLDSLNVEEMHSAVAYLRYRLEGGQPVLPLDNAENDQG